MSLPNTKSYPPSQNYTEYSKSLESDKIAPGKELDKRATKALQIGGGLFSKIAPKGQSQFK